jgi:hypothetical protein
MEGDGDPWRTCSHARLGGGELSVCDYLSSWDEIFALHSACDLFTAEPWTRWFWQYHSARSCRTTIHVTSAVSMTHTSTKQHRPSPANSISGLPRASSPMGSPYCVGLSEARSGHSRAKTPR